MQIIRHRRNTIEELKDTPEHLGVEIDIRSSGKDLLLTHDPFAGGTDFDEWLQHFRHRTLILNVKEEGLEDAVLTRVHEHRIEEFFFLDQSFPFLIRTASRGESRCAVRVSEHESIETALTLAHKVRWVWVDCFTRFPLTHEQADRLHAAGFSLCLVSPELQGRAGRAEISTMRELLARQGITAEAVCTKTPELWA